MAKDSIESMSPAYVRWLTRYDVINSLKGGTLTMRAAGTKWLPQETEEPNGKYQVRLERSILFEGYDDTVKSIAAKPFVEPVEIDYKFTGSLVDFPKNVDRLGTDLTSFCRALLEDAVHSGLSHILLDLPGMKATNLKEEKDNDLRPYFTHITAENLFFWELTTLNNGTSELTEIRWKSTTTKKKGIYGQEEVSVITRMTKTEWEVWEKKEKADDTGEAYARIKKGTHDLGKIPLITFYTNPKGKMSAVPPMEGLAWLNIIHWQSMSDQRNILRYVRAAILFARGLGDKDIVVGPNAFVNSDNPEALLSYVVAPADGTEAGERDLKIIEDQMQVSGMKPFIERSQASTATGKVIDKENNETVVQSWVRLEEDAIANAIIAVIAMADKKAQPVTREELGLRIFSEFDSTSSSEMKVQALGIASNGARPVLPRRVIVESLQEMGIVSKKENVLDLLKELDKELAAIGFNDVNVIDEDENDPEDDDAGTDD